MRRIPDRNKWTWKKKARLKDNINWKWRPDILFLKYILMKHLHIQPSEFDRMEYTDFILLVNMIEFEKEREKINYKRLEQQYNVRNRR